MIEARIELATAKFAKEVEYNIPDQHIYLNRKSVIWKDELAVPVNYADIKKLTSNEVWLRPTQSLLQKWLREVHEVEINILTGGDNKVKFYIPDAKIDTSRMHGGHFETYEAALEEALINALGMVLNRKVK